MKILIATFIFAYGFMFGTIYSSGGPAYARCIVTEGTSFYQYLAGVK